MNIPGIIAASMMVAGLTLPMVAKAGGGIVDQSIDALFNLRDQLQAVVMKSVPGVAEAMQEGPPPEGSSESTIAYFTRMQGKLQDLYDINKNLLQAQKKLQKVDLQLLVKLPKDDPRRQTITTEIKDIGSGMVATQKSMDDFGARLAKFNQAIADYDRKNGTHTQLRNAASDSVRSARAASQSSVRGTARCPDGH